MIYPETTFDRMVDDAIEAAQRKTTINDCVIDLLKEGWTSRADAFSEIGTLDLPKRVSELRKTGIVIETRKVKRQNRYGKTIYHNEYRIKEEIK